MLLKGKNAVVTGCSRGIGQAVAGLFARNGANVWACEIRATPEFEARCGELSRECGVEVTPVCFDLTDAAQVKAGVQTILASRRPIDVLVNNAGVVASENRLFQMTPVDEMRRVFDVNFFATMLLTQYVSRQMARQKAGSIVNVASIAGIDGDPAQIDYVASKAALIGATKKLALELGEAGIRVNAVAPGLTDTEMARHMTEAKQRATIDRAIMKRLGRPEEIAGVILFLASPLSSFVTGQVIRADGGVI